MEVTNRDRAIFGNFWAKMRAEKAAAAAGEVAPQAAQAAQAATDAAPVATHGVGDVLAAMRSNHGSVGDQVSRLIGLTRGTERLESPALTTAANGTMDVLSQIRAMVDGGIAAHSGGAQAVQGAVAATDAAAPAAADVGSMLSQLSQHIADPSLRAQVLARVDQTVSQAIGAVGPEAEGILAQRIATSGISADDLGKVLASAIDDVAKLATKAV